jgi:hypothetical protein
VQFFSEFSHSYKVVQSNSTFGQGLGFKVASSMFGKFLVHAWKSCGCLNKEYSILVNLGMVLNGVLPSLNRNRLLIT